MITLKKSEEIALMREGGKIAGLVLSETAAQVRIGVSTGDLDRFAGRRIEDLGATPSFKGFESYRFATCININEGVVHGIPKGNVILKEGDVVKIDLGVFFKGFHTDTALSCLVGGNESKWREKTRFLEVGKKALSEAIKKCHVGNRLGDVSAEIQEIVEGSGFRVVEELVGHGVGKRLHEDPQVPGLGKKGTGLFLREGMTLAIEVIYTSGQGGIVSGADGWTLSMADGKMSGLFEHTVALGKKGVETLTLGGFLC